MDTGREFHDDDV